MNPTSAMDAVDLALAFYKAPARYHDLLHGRAPLPAGMDKLLRLANGASPDELGIRTGDFVHSDERLQAVHFFIEQVLLAHQSDHYRLLGVDASADLEQIKEHHRQLMRLFHPDREGTVDELKATYATRINLAYNALRQPDSRAAYDTSLSQARASAPQDRQRPAFRRPERGIWQSMPSALVRNLPQFVLGGIALVAAISVAAVYLDRPPVGAIGWEPGDKPDMQAGRAPVPLQTAAVLAQTESAEQLVDIPQEQRAAPEPAYKPDVSALAAPIMKAAPPAPVAAMADKPSPAAHLQAPSPRVAAKPASAAAPPVKITLAASSRTDGAGVIPQPPAETRPAPLVQTADAPPRANPSIRLSVLMQDFPPAPTSVQPAAEKLASVAPLALPPPAPPKAAPLPPPPSPAVSETELVRLISRLSSHYASGDLNNFMALFDNSARTEDGGTAQIRSDYGNLFSHTLQRDIVIWDMAWQQNGETAIGKGNYQTHVVRNGETAARTLSGQIRIEVVKRGDDVLIKTFNHVVKR